MSVVKLLSDEDFTEYTRLSNEAYPVMFSGFTDERAQPETIEEF